MSDEIEQIEGGMSLSEAREMMEDISSVNLDEVAPQTVTVAFRDIVQHKDGSYEMELVHKEIRTFVPMFLFNRMLANQKKAQKARKKWQAERTTAKASEEEQAIDDFEAEPEAFDFMAMADEAYRRLLAESDPMILWQAREVLTVWQLTDKSMSLKRLLLGLNFERITGLFSRFFGGMLLQKRR
jgi:hypothetical protein